MCRGWPGVCLDTADLHPSDTVTLRMLLYCSAASVRTICTHCLAPKLTARLLSVCDRPLSR